MTQQQVGLCPLPNRPTLNPSLSENRVKLKIDDTTELEPLLGGTPNPFLGGGLRPSHPLFLS